MQKKIYFVHTVCPRNHYIEIDNTSWTFSTSVQKSKPCSSRFLEKASDEYLDIFVQKELRIVIVVIS